jgi:hypothetical protein
VDKYTIILNIGTIDGVRKDMRFSIKGKKQINDPDSGKPIGYYKYDKAIVVINEVQDKISIARPPVSIGLGIPSVDSFLFGDERKPLTDEPSSLFNQNVEIGDEAIQT